MHILSNVWSLNAVFSYWIQSDILLSILSSVELGMNWMYCPRWISSLQKTIKIIFSLTALGWYCDYTNSSHVTQSNMEIFVFSKHMGAGVSQNIVQQSLYLPNKKNGYNHWLIWEMFMRYWAEDLKQTNKIICKYKQKTCQEIGEIQWNAENRAGKSAVGDCWSFWYIVL